MKHTRVAVLISRILNIDVAGVKDEGEASKADERAAQVSIKVFRF